MTSILEAMRAKMIAEKGGQTEEPRRPTVKELSPLDVDLTQDVIVMTMDNFDELQEDLEELDKSEDQFKEVVPVEPEPPLLSGLVSSGSDINRVVLLGDDACDFSEVRSLHGVLGFLSHRKFDRAFGEIAIARTGSKWMYISRSSLIFNSTVLVKRGASSDAALDMLIEKSKEQK